MKETVGFELIRASAPSRVVVQWLKKIFKVIRYTQGMSLNPATRIFMPDYYKLG
jgi:hypothetical protein